MWNEEEASAKAPGEAVGGKGLFIGLASLSLALLLFFLWLLFFLLEPRMAAFGTGLIAASRVVIALVGLAVVAAVASDFLSAGVGVRLIPGGLGHRLALIALLPVSEKLGRFAGVSSDRVKAGFIDFSNALLKARLERAGEGGIPVPTLIGTRRASASPGVPGTCCGWTGGCAEEGPAEAQTDRGFAAVKARTVGGVLLVLPHCVQNSECTRELGEDARNCEECGSCAMRELKRLVLRYGIQNRIVGGGTLALMAVRELRPWAVVGVACERELVAAMKELWGLPIMAIPNSRPEGPCRNTRVNVSLVEEALRILLKRPGPHCSIH